MERDLVQQLPPRRVLPEAESEIDLIACSICLRVLDGGEWIAAERVIRERRSYELESPPRLRAAVCDLCAESIQDRRAQAEAVAA